MSKVSNENKHQDKTYTSYTCPNDFKDWKTSSDLLCHCVQNGIETITCNEDGIKSDKRSFIGVAFFGLGRIGVVHFENVMRSPRTQLMYLVEKCQIKSNDMQKKWNIPKESMIYSEAESERVLADPKVDCVIICTPTHTHEELILKALKASGIFHDFAVHDIGLMCWILEEYPISVYVQAYAFYSQIKALNDYDTVAIMFRFKSGTTGIIDLSRFAAYGYDQRIEVFGSKGMLISGDPHPTSITSYSESGETTLPFPQSFITRYRESYVEELEHFFDAVQGYCEVSITKERVLAVNRISAACEESARTGKVVQLEWS